MLSFSVNTALTTLTPLALFVVGMAIYAIFIFSFYRFIATRDIFEFNLRRFHDKTEWVWLKKILYVLLYILEYIIIFPIFVTLWFAVFAALLTLLSKNQDVSIVLLIAMAIVSSVRVTAYYNEDLSKDLAKMLPFGLLAVLLVDITFFSYSEALEAFYQIPTLFGTIAYYLIFAVMIEFVLRIFTAIFRRNNDSVEEK